MRVSNYMTPEVIVLRPDNTIYDASCLFVEKKIDGAPVVDEEGRIVGLITKTHLLRSITQHIPSSTLLTEIMTKKVNTILHDDDIRKIDIMYNGRYPVMENDQLIGFITKSDIMVALYQIIDEITGQMEAVIQSTYNPIISVNRQGAIVIWNQAVEEATGLKKRDVIGQFINDIIPENGLLKIVATGEMELGVRLPIGDNVMITNRAPVFKNGEITGAVAVLYDISELERISKELEYVKIMNREMDAIIDSSFDGLYITDGQGVTMRVNKAIERVTGLGAEELINKSMDELVDNGVFSSSGTIMALKEKKAVTTSISTITGKQLLVSSNPVFDGKGQVFCVVTNVRDISELNQLKKKVEELEGLKNHFQLQLNQLKTKLSGQLIYASQAMENVICKSMKVAEVDSTVLIKGESGVGKELIAEVIHSNSKRKKGPFIKINCAAIPENLLESELFGYEAGAFTGARNDGKPGFFELANLGTILLDEIGDLPIHLQVKLLRVLQEREIIRVGGTKPIPVDVRIIAMTNRNLEKMVKNSEFRKDLYYRINVIPIYVPALRERKTDIPFLIQHFIRKYNERYELNKSMELSAIDILTEYNWPGNIRELENLIEQLIVITNEEFISISDIPSTFIKAELIEEDRGYILVKGIVPLQTGVEIVEELLIRKAMESTSTCYKVAKILKVNPSTISRKARKYGIKIN